MSCKQGHFSFQSALLSFTLRTVAFRDFILYKFLHRRQGLVDIDIASYDIRDMYPQPPLRMDSTRRCKCTRIRFLFVGGKE